MIEKHTHPPDMTDVFFFSISAVVGAAELVLPLLEKPMNYALFQNPVSCFAVC